jgi:CheY-like chemotaxis protein
MNSPDRNKKPAKLKTILVLDGDALVRMPVVQYLRDCGYRVVEAATTEEAIAITEDRHSGRFGVKRDRDPRINERLWVRPMGSLSPT